MDSLSLRVSSIKTSENKKKNLEIKMNILKIPETIFNNEDFFKPKIKSFVNDFNNAPTVEMQIKSVKTAFSLVNGSESTGDHFVVRILSKLYFEAPPKHPLKNTISKLLQNGNCNSETTISETLNAIIIQHINEVELSSSIEDRNTIVTQISSCFENFPIGLQAIGECLEQVYAFLDESLQIYINNFRKPLSPASKSEIFVFIHNITRLALSCIQRYANKTQSTFALDDFSNKLNFIIETQEVPMDTKVNCGIFLVLKSTLNDSFEIIIEMMKNDGRNGNDIHILCMSIGIINLINDIHHPDIVSYEIISLTIKSLIEIANKNSTEQSILLAVCRGLNQLFKRLLFFNIIETEESHVTCDLDRCLIFIWTFGDHCMDAVRHLCRDLLQNIIKLTQSYGYLKSITDEVFRLVASNSFQPKLRCLALECLCFVLGTNHIFEKIPNINTILLDQMAILSWTTYEKLMSTNSKEVDVEYWYQKWVKPLLVHAKIEHEFLQVNEMLISKAIIVNSNVVKLIFSEKEKLPIETYLFVMWTMRKNGQKLEINWQPANDSVIKRAKFHTSDDVRIMHLKILVDVHKSTELFYAEDLNEMFEFLIYNCNCQSPAMRGKIISFMSKAFNRLQASYGVIVKSDNDEAERYYQKFLLDLFDFFTSNLIPGANLSRRVISLTLLREMLAICKKILPFDNRHWTVESINALISTLSDSYEGNKILVNEIIKYCPKHLIKDDSLIDLDRLALLATSAKPAESITAAYLLEMYCITGAYFQNYYDAIMWCERLLENGLIIAEQSLLTAARDNPMYGLVFCIRHLISKMNFNCNAEDNEKFRNFFEKLIKTCKRLMKVVGPIVNSSSPEGHFPNDFSEIGQFLQDNEGTWDTDGQTFEANNSDNCKTTPQMILLCAWRTVKDVSLLLGDIALTLPIKCDSSISDGLLTTEEILDIGVHFQELLSEIKHRGAFEQAYVGFSKLCVRLWQADIADLHNSPMQWLKDLLAVVSSKENLSNLRRDKMCATRRSAGIPFMIQALITSELQVCSSTALHYSMTELIELSRNNSDPELRIHSLNILRALFRCSDLGDSVAEYISDGIECAILGYNATSWPERNSATLLFAALITRIFGVQRTRDSENLNIRNRMTGRIFFLKYPRLYDFFNDQLTASVSLIDNDKRPTTLHPLLILLSRLYPSALEGTESNLQLSQFITVIGKCGHSPEFETRRLAAKAMVAIVIHNEVFKYLHIIFNNLKIYLKKQNRNQNVIHGSLLQMLFLIQSIKEKHVMDVTDINRQMETFLISIIDIKISNIDSFITQKTYADILIEILFRMDKNSFNTFRFDSTNLMSILNFQIQMKNNIGLPETVKSFTILQLILQLVIFPKWTKLDNHTTLLSKSFISESIEYVKTILNILTLILYKNNPIISEIVDCSDIEINFVHFLNETERDYIQMELQNSDIVIKDLKNLIENSNFPSYCIMLSYLILSKISNDFLDFKQLIDIMDSVKLQTDEIRTAVLQYVITRWDYTGNNSSSVNAIAILLNTLKEMAEPHHKMQLRLTVAQFFNNLSKNWLEKIINSKLTFFGFIEIVLLLLRDEDIDVRESISQFVFNLPKINKTFEDTPVSTYTEKLFIDWIDDRFNEYKYQTSEKFWYELITSLMPVKDSLTIDDIKLFDKNEANEYGEVVITYKMALQKMHKS